MSPILTGIVASGISGHLTPPWAGPEGAYDSIASTLVPAGGVSSITFDGIPQNYKHLQIRMSARSTRASTHTCYALLRFNGDTTSSYGLHQGLFGFGAGGGVSSAWNGTFSGAIVERLTGNSANSSGFGAVIVDIPDYSSPNKNKVLMSIGGVELNNNDTTGSIYRETNFWLNTNPIQSITMTIEGGSTIAENTRVSLYGVK